MHTIEHIQAAWKALPRSAKRKVWNAFTQSIDSGDQGYDPFYLVLWPMWQTGADPI
jgi:hypothetical protein